jgi:hypothetical protein
VYIIPARIKMANTSNWYVPSQPYNGSPGQATYGGGGYGSSAIQYRSGLDAARAANQAPYAQYPDGYLGSMSFDRRQDKLMGAVQDQLNKKSYQRGVHKGEKIASSDYYWDRASGITPMSGIEREARTAARTGSTISVQRFAPKGNPVERLAHLGKTAGLTPPEQQKLYKQYGVSIAKNPVVISDPDAKARMQKMRPSWI